MIGGGSLFLLCVSSVKRGQKIFFSTPVAGRRRAVEGCVHVRAGDVGSPPKYILTEMQKGEVGGGLEA